MSYSWKNKSWYGNNLVDAIKSEVDVIIFSIAQLKINLQLNEGKYGI